MTSTNRLGARSGSGKAFMMTLVALPLALALSALTSAPGVDAEVLRNYTLTMSARDIAEAAKRCADSGRGCERPLLVRAARRPTKGGGGGGGGGDATWMRHT